MKFLVIKLLIAGVFALCSGVGEGSGVWKDSGGSGTETQGSLVKACITSNDSIVPWDVPPYGKVYFTPVKNVYTCLDTVTLPKEYGVETVMAYDHLLEAGYAYYYYADDILKTPTENPRKLMIHNGTFGGQVNHKKEFQQLISEVQTSGKATGMLAYKINDVLLRGRDAHTSLLALPDTVAFYDENFNPEDSHWPGRWSLEKLENGTVKVISINDDLQKTVVSINGEEPLSFLKNFTLMTGLGNTVQFKSAGVRLNNFLDSFANSKTSTGIVWMSAGGTGDFSKLPDKLVLTYEDGSSDTLLVLITVPEAFIDVPPNNISDIIISNRFASFKIYEDTLRNMTSTRKRKRSSFASSSLEFVDFREGSGAPYSSFAVLENAMVWKLPTFESPIWEPSHRKQVEFWNNMVNEANKKNITELIIDISDNSGGYSDNAWRNLALLYQGVNPGDIVHNFTVRVTDEMVSMNAAWNASQDIWNSLLSSDAIASKVVAELKSLSLDEIKESFKPLKALSKFDKSVTTKNSPLWFKTDSALRESVINIIEFIEKNGLTKVPDSKVKAFLYGLSDVIIPPKFCEKNPSINCTALDPVWTTELNQGGTLVNATVPLVAGSYFKIDEYVSDNFGVFNLTGVLPSPFKSYYLLSNSKVVGSSANMFESGMRYLSRVYEKTYPKTLTFSMGCFGDGYECEMTQFQGLIDQSEGLISRMYDAALPLKSLVEILDLLPRDLLSSANISEAQLERFQESVSSLYELLPTPPALGDGFPRIASFALLPAGDTKLTIPQEYFSRPADIHLSIWTKPHGMRQNPDNLATMENVYKQVLISGADIAK